MPVLDARTANGIQGTDVTIGEGYSEQGYQDEEFGSSSSHGICELFILSYILTVEGFIIPICSLFGNIP